MLRYKIGINKQNEVSFNVNQFYLRTGYPRLCTGYGRFKVYRCQFKINGIHL